MYFLPVTYVEQPDMKSMSNKKQAMNIMALKNQSNMHEIQLQTNFDPAMNHCLSTCKKVDGLRVKDSLLYFVMG